MKIKLFLIVSFTALPVFAAEIPKKRATESFRAEHVVLHNHLLEVEQWTGELFREGKSAQKKTMLQIVSFFKEHIKPHAEWEEKKLYPAVDKRASRGPEPFTSTMRYEHRIVARWIDELDKEASSKKPDPKAFARESYQLLGLIKAHFEEEEEVLLPVLDRSMTPEQFKFEILDGAP